MSWEIHNCTHSPEVFDLVENFIKEEYGDGYFNGTWMLISFWEDLVASESTSNVCFKQNLAMKTLLRMCLFLRIIPSKQSWSQMALSRMLFSRMSVAVLTFPTWR